jgi:CDP-diacylglycerol--serine O-phosphatidyltransferase
MSYLLVAEIPLFALKFKNFGWADNKIRYSFLIISVILLILFQFIAIPFIIFLYIIMSVISNVMNRAKTL